jgi:hypothetical protein
MIKKDLNNIILAERDSFAILLLIKINGGGKPYLLLLNFLSKAGVSIFSIMSPHVGAMLRHGDFFVMYHRLSLWAANIFIPFYMI